MDFGAHEYDRADYEVVKEACCLRCRGSFSCPRCTGSYQLAVTEPFHYTYSLHIEESRDLVLNAVITDISDGGMGIQTDYPLQPDSLLAFDNGTEEKTGVVRWRKTADAEESGFRAGIEFVSN